MEWGHKRGVSVPPRGGRGTLRGVQVEGDSRYRVGGMGFSLSLSFFSLFMLFFWVVEENESQICKLQLLNKERERERVLKVGGPHQCLSILIFLISLRVLGWLLACKRELRNM